MDKAVSTILLSDDKEEIKHADSVPAGSSDYEILSEEDLEKQFT